MRLQKYMALCGVASRRKSEEMIKNGLVQVNGQTVTEMGLQVLENDTVTVEGKQIRPEIEKHYILYHKPMGEITSVRDDRGRETVMDHFRDYPVRLFPVGRLDYDSEGLLILTNDGELAEKLTHPSHSVQKTYLARISMRLSKVELQKLQKGIILDDGFRTSAAKVYVIREEAFASAVLITIHEGHNRQIRRMFEAVGHKVLLLRRIRFGPIDLKGLEIGKWRNLTEQEIAALKSL